MDDTLKRIFQTIGLFIGIIVFFAVALFFMGAIDITPANKFAVVDKYQNCDVVRYETHGRYYYFLQCKQ
jgi:hypothetical protein